MIDRPPRVRACALAPQEGWGRIFGSRKSLIEEQESFQIKKTADTQGKPILDYKEPKKQSVIETTGKMECCNPLYQSGFKNDQYYSKHETQCNEIRFKPYDSIESPPEKSVPLDVFGKPDDYRWETIYGQAYNTYHDPREGVTFQQTTAEYNGRQPGCQHLAPGPVPPTGTRLLCDGKITCCYEEDLFCEELNDYCNQRQQAWGESPKISKDVYLQPDSYRWKTEYDTSYNMHPDGTWKKEHQTI